MRGQKIAGLGMVPVAALGAMVAYADPLLSDNPGTFGLPGLIDMPTAESVPEGMIGATVFRFGAGLRVTATFQVTDRLQGAFRYSRVPGIFTNGTALYDRSFDVQYRLLDEKGWRPAVAIGLRDFIGTGVYSGEYIVATKTITPRLRATAGLGWGRLGTNGDIGSPFGSRPVLDIGEGGKANTDQWFRGPAAPFFGFAWDANDKLTLKAEYSSDAYPRETAAGTLSRDSSINFGFDYRINKSASVSGYYLYGSEVGLQFNLAIDPRKPPAPSGLETAPLPVRPRPSPVQRSRRLGHRLDRRSRSASRRPDRRRQGDGERRDGAGKHGAFGDPGRGAAPQPDATSPSRKRSAAPPASSPAPCRPRSRRWSSPRLPRACRPPPSRSPAATWKRWKARNSAGDPAPGGVQRRRCRRSSGLVPPNMSIRVSSGRSRPMARRASSTPTIPCGPISASNSRAATNSRRG